MKNQLRGIWARVLQEDPSSIGGTDVFFEIGGDSILAQKLSIEAYKQGISLSVQQIFMQSSLDEMAREARLLKRKEDSTINDIQVSEPFASLVSESERYQLIESIALMCHVPSATVQNAYRCSPIQEGFVSVPEEDANRSVRQLVYRISDSVPLYWLQQAWRDVIRDNPVLRTRICHLGNGIGFVQAVIEEEVVWKTANANISEFLLKDANLRMLLGHPFLRYTIIIDRDPKGRTQRYFVWTVHHALCDGTSILELLDDVSRRFHNKTILPRPPFEAFIQSPSIATNITQEREFWQRSLSGINPTPYPSFPRDVDFRVNTSSVVERAISIDQESQFGITKALFLRAAWAILLSHLTGTQEIVFGAINNGRGSAVSGISQIIGPTINSTPLALRIDPKESLTSFLQRVTSQATAIMTFEHSGVSRIRKFLAEVGSTAADFQCSFLVHSMDFREAATPATSRMGLEYLDKWGKKERHPYPLLLNITLSETTLATLKVQYDEKVILTQQVYDLINQYQSVITQMGKARKDTLIGSISPVSEQDSV